MRNPVVLLESRSIVFVLPVSSRCLLFRKELLGYSLHSAATMTYGEIEIDAIFAIYEKCSELRCRGG